MICLFIGLSGILSISHSKFRDLDYQYCKVVMLLGFASIIRFPVLVDKMKNHCVMQFIPILSILVTIPILYFGKTPVMTIVGLTVPLFIVCSMCILSRQLVNSFPRQHRTCFKILFHVFCVVLSMIATFPIFGLLGVFLLFGSVAVGNLQIPAALGRIVLSTMRLNQIHLTRNTRNILVVRSLYAFYSIVSIQGALYLLACIIDSLFSGLICSLIAKEMGNFHKMGIDAIGYYYEETVIKCTSEGCFSWNLFSYSIHKLESNNISDQVSALFIMCSHLKFEIQGCLSKIILHPRTVTILMDLLECPADETHHMLIKVLAANILKMLSHDIRIYKIRGSLENVLSLLHPQIVGDVHQSEDTDSLKHLILHNMSNPNFLPHEVDGVEGKIEVCLPLLGLQILHRLGQRRVNCTEFNKLELITTVIDFLHQTSNSIVSEDEHNIRYASLKLIDCLASTTGQLGRDLQENIIKQPLFLGSLNALLHNSWIEREETKLVVSIFSKLAVEDEGLISDTGNFIPKLLSLFFSNDEDFSMVAGKALSCLTVEMNNCVLMFDIGGQRLIDNLVDNLHSFCHICSASKILQSLFRHCTESIYASVTLETLNSAAEQVREILEVHSY